MSLEMNDEIIELANDVIEKADNYFYELAKLHGKKGFVWIKNDETNQLVVYTRGEYTSQIVGILESLDANKPSSDLSPQQELLEAYRDALIEITECGSLDRATFVALNALEGK